MLAAQKPTLIEIAEKLIKQQNKYLWLIIDTYKVILLLIVKVEVFIFFLNLHLNSVVFQVLKRMKKSDMTHQIETTCIIIRKKLCQKEQNHWISLTVVTHFKFLFVNWIQLWISNTKNMQNRSQNSAKKKLFHRWKQHDFSHVDIIDSNIAIDNILTININKLIDIYTNTGLRYWIIHL